VGDFGVTIIDFGHSMKCNDQKTKDREYAQLRYILNSEDQGASSVNGDLASNI